MHLLLYSNRKKNENIGTNCTARGIPLHFGEGFIVVSSWKRKMSTPIIEFDKEMGEVMQRKKKEWHESQAIFYMV